MKRFLFSVMLCVSLILSTHIGIKAESNVDIEKISETGDALYEEDEFDLRGELTGYGVPLSEEDNLTLKGATAKGPTEQEVYNKMIALKSQYPEGMRWTNDNYYRWKGGIYSGGYGCAGFCFILSDEAFGDLPARMITNITIKDVRVGDILRINNDTHSVSVLEVHDDYVVIAEGNYNSSIHWGRTLSAAKVADSTHLLTRYPVKEEVTPVDVSYRTHVQSFGWQNNVKNGAVSGTSGMSKRLEGIEINVSGNSSLGIQYTTHCQSYGWLPWSANGEMNGTEGEAKRLEAIQIQLTGADKDKYDVCYRVHAQSYGWLGWAKNGAPAGTAGYSKRLEAIQILVVPKDESFDTNIGNIKSARTEAYIAITGTSPVVASTATSAKNPVIPGDENTNIAYNTHIQTYGWQGWKYNRQMSGTSGEAKRLEAICIKLTNKQYAGGIAYTTHVQSYGWQGNVDDSSTWKKNGEVSGTSGESKRLEAIRIKLTGEMEKHYEIYYRVHAQSFGWLGWTNNGFPAGTSGLGKRLEGIQIVLLPKGYAAPPDNYGGITSSDSFSYLEY